ncbi:calumenin, partial [Tanacetum coccineum]
MSKVSVLIYITVAILILVLISHSPNKNSSNRQNRRHRRLKLRSNFTTTPTTADHHISFDPLIADIERKREDKQWEQTHYFNKDGDGDDVAPGMEAQPEWEDFIDAEDYLNDEHKFNITHRLVLLFPRIDVHPADGFVSEHELTQWNLDQSQREVLHRSQREMELHDKNRDGLVAFHEYSPPSWVRDA